MDASGPFLQKISIVLLSLLFFSSTAFPAPTELQQIEAPSNDQRDLERREAVGQPVGHALPIAVIKYQEEENDLLKRQAGLYWGPKYVGNLKLYLTNPHIGYAGPKFPNANHVNFHVDKKDPGPRGTYSEVVNMHIVKYTRGGSSCLYVWDSVTKKVVFDKCFDDFTDAIGEAVEAVREFVKDLLENADFVASVVIIGALVIALAAVIASLGAVAVA